MFQCVTLFSRRRLIAGALAATIGSGAIGLGTGCQAVPALVGVGVQLCIETIKTLLDAPRQEPPPNSEPCGRIEWWVRGYLLKFCFTCDPTQPGEIFVQFDCAGDFFPMKLRRIREAPSDILENGIHIKKLDCDQRLLAAGAAAMDIARQLGELQLSAPNHRVFPDRSKYQQLDVFIDGLPAPRRGDFSVDAGANISLAGDLDELAHYAMTIGVTELSYTDGSDLWEIHTNPEVSAIMVLKNDAYYDGRFLFAPKE
jgi:hypothetical protein